jgi:hypothetical protein
MGSLCQTATPEGKEVSVGKLIMGFVLGIVVATIGFSGVARLLDSGVDVVKEKSQEIAR